MQDPDSVQKFHKTFSESLSDCVQSKPVEAKWNYLRDTIHSTALEIFGKKIKKNNDWFDANFDKMSPVIEEKRAAFLKFKQSPNVNSLQTLRNARSKSKQVARKCANEYWLQLSSDMEAAAACGNVRGLHEGIKKALGPVQSKVAHIKSSNGEIITDGGKQMQRWVEFYSDLYTNDNHVAPSALDAIESLPTMDELDEVPTIEELSKAIDKLTPRSAPGADGIPPDLIKYCKNSLLSPIYEILHQCWSEGIVPQDMRDAKIITLYKNKGDRSDCNSYRGISLLSIIGKVFARTILSRLQRLAERVYPESQCGFRASRSTTDMIFSVRQIQEKCREQRQPLYMAFIDLTKAFDMVSRDGLFDILRKIGCPPRLLHLITSFHSNMHGTIQYDGKSSDPFIVSCGVKQGCVLAPTLFGIFFSILLKHAFNSCDEGIYLHTRSDGNLFNIRRLKAKTKIHTILVRELLFADDAALVSHDEPTLQSLLHRFSTACADFGLTISITKTNVLCQNVPSQPSVNINNYTLDVVKQATYLGSVISDNLSLDDEINKRIGKAAANFSRLNTRVWSNINLSIRTKIAVYSACVVSTLLYASETWTTYQKQERRLNNFHLRCLRRILEISWLDKVPDTEVLSRSGLTTIYTILRQRRLRWLGHVRRMDDGRIPKDILYGELELGSREACCPMLRFKDVCKRDMKAMNMNVDEWETTADNRTLWRTTVSHHLKLGETKILCQAENKRAQRKARSNTTPAPTNYRCLTCDKDCHSSIGLFSHSRSCFKCST
jgi:hypothetical protein